MSKKFRTKNASDLSEVSVPVVKTTIKSSEGKVHFFLLEAITQGRSCSRNYGKSISGRLARDDLFSFLSYTTQDCLPRVGITTLSWALITKKMKHRLAYQPVLQKHFLNCVSLFQIILVCVKLTNTQKTVTVRAKAGYH